MFEIERMKQAISSRNGLARTNLFQVNLPLIVGGGIRSLEDAGNLLAAGAEKIAINTAAVNRTPLVRCHSLLIAARAASKYAAFDTINRPST